MKESLIPVINQLAEKDPTFDGIIPQVNRDPHQLFSALLSPDTLDQMPKVFLDDVVSVMKIALIHSLHSVYLWSLGFVAVGFVIFCLSAKSRLLLKSIPKRMCSISTFEAM